MFELASWSVAAVRALKARARMRALGIILALFLSRVIMVEDWLSIYMAAEQGFGVKHGLDVD